MRVFRLILPAGLAAALAFGAGTPAKADGDAAAGIAGLALFGLLLGEALDDDDHDRGYGYGYGSRSHGRRFDDHGFRGDRFDRGGRFDRGSRFGSDRFGNRRGSGRSFGGPRFQGRGDAGRFSR